MYITFCEHLYLISQCTGDWLTFYWNFFKVLNCNFFTALGTSTERKNQTTSRMYLKNYNINYNTNSISQTEHWKMNRYLQYLCHLPSNFFCMLYITLNNILMYGNRTGQKLFGNVIMILITKPLFNFGLQIFIPLIRHNHHSLQLWIMIFFLLIISQLLSYHYYFTDNNNNNNNTNTYTLMIVDQL